MNFGELSAWQNFYVIVGSAAGALTGLQFVAMALIADLPMEAKELEAGHVFATPTILHFGAVLTTAAVLAMPWHGIIALGFVVGMFGLAGLVYTLRVAWSMRIQKSYKPVAEDWLFRSVLPFLSYVCVLIAAAMMRNFTRESLFVLASGMLLLLAIGIHNSWDNVTFLVFTKSKSRS